MRKVLVTGGTGFVGKRLRLIKPGWTYVGSKDCDLTSLSDFESDWTKPKTKNWCEEKMRGCENISSNFEGVRKKNWYL